ncbi:hypothetical protein ES703_94334 [subsurface metagenome]
MNWTDDDDSDAEVSTTSTYNFNMPAVNVNYTANFIKILTVEISHANLGNKDKENYWDLHVWVTINNTLVETFPGKMIIKSYQPGTPEITKFYPESGVPTDITIASGSHKYPPGGSTYWLLSKVAKGQGKPGNVFVEIWIYDTSDNVVAYASRTAN